MAEDRLADLLVGAGFAVVSFDPPGAYRSSRPSRGDMAEMLGCCGEALDVAGVQPPVLVVGHSMGSLCALGLAIERPGLVARLVLVGSLSGFPAARRWSIPHNWRPWRDQQWWQCLWLGTRQMLGLGTLATYRRLDNLVEHASVVNPALAEVFAVEHGDELRPQPARAIWLQTVRKVDYRRRLAEVEAPTLVVVGRHDPQTPMPCAHELVAGIARSRLVTFERSGHAPFVEEPEAFTREVTTFLRQRDVPRCS
jgi:proline iminopeptidase